MKIPVAKIPSALFFMALVLYSTALNAQCDCGTNLNVNPGAYYNKKAFGYDGDGFINQYSYIFQFPCMGEPIESFSYYYYEILYREKGTSAWTVEEIGGDIAEGGDLLIAATSLEPCKTYELRVTCPECIADPNSLYCDSELQLKRFLEDSTHTLHNVSRIWEVCYSPISNQPILNFKVASVDTANHAVKVQWDHLPGPATYQLWYRTSPTSPLIDLGTTDLYEFQINNLETCASYEVLVQGSAECCGGTKFSQSASLSFSLTACMSNLKRVDLITGNSAHLSWAPLNPNLPPDSYEVQWWRQISNVFTASTQATEYAVSDLNPGSIYNVKIISHCGSQVCSGSSEVVNFQTNCELNEPNNSFQTATTVSFDFNHSNANISPAGDVDYFKFTPLVCQIEVKIDDPDLAGFPNADPLYWVGNDLPYQLYDHDFQEIPKSVGYWDPQGRFHANTHLVTPGQEYYLVVRGPNGRESLNCYTFNVFPCLDCDPLANLEIIGEDKILTLPATQTYGIGDTNAGVEWSVSGPAHLTTFPDPANCQLDMYGSGTIVLKALVTRCDGLTASLEKEIFVSDACNIVGNYSNAVKGDTLREGLHFVTSLDYQIKLDLPDTLSFTVYPYEGAATWMIEDNTISVHQSSPLASLRIVLLGGDCTGVDGIYSFVEGSVDSSAVSIEWSIRPNPVAHTLQIKPLISAGVPAGAVPEGLKIWLYSSDGKLVAEQQGSTQATNTLNMALLPAGTYVLRLFYGTNWRQFRIVKR